MTRSVRAFAPASVSNVACGFDVLGFALQSDGKGRSGLGDLVTATRRRRPASNREGVRITRITGDDRLPIEADRNTAAVAAAALLESEAPEVAIDLEIDKRMPLESGLGSSAASAVAAVVAVDELLGLELPRPTLLRYALAGEMVASGGAHADNLAPSLFGGMVLVRSLEPDPDVVELPTADLCCALAHPHAWVNTRESRSSLDRELPLGRAVTQWGNVGALVAALYRGDLELLSRALVDVVAEPIRGPKVPGFFRAQAAAMEAGALGCSLSGSGPTLFALCDGEDRARAVATAMATTFEQAVNVSCDELVSSLPAPGARVIGDTEA